MSKITNAPYGIRLIATSGHELAMMLYVLDDHAKKHDTLTDQAKEFRAQRDQFKTIAQEMEANANGWRRSAEKRNEDYVTLAQHCESITQQLEAAKAATVRDHADWSELSEGQTKEILRLREELEEAAAHLNGAVNQVAKDTTDWNQLVHELNNRADHFKKEAARHQQIAELGQQQADAKISALIETNQHLHQQVGRLENELSEAKAPLGKVGTTGNPAAITGNPWVIKTPAAPYLGIKWPANPQTVQQGSVPTPAQQAEFDRWEQEKQRQVAAKIAHEDATIGHNDLHPDEDPHDHLNPDQCRAGFRKDWVGPLGNAQWSVTYCGGQQGHPGAHTGGIAGDRVTWNDDEPAADARDVIPHHPV